MQVNGRFSEDSSGTSDERDDVRSASISPSSHSQSPPTSSSRLGGKCMGLGWLLGDVYNSEV